MFMFFIVIKLITEREVYTVRYREHSALITPVQLPLLRTWVGAEA